MQRFSELSVQADQTPCCTCFGLQPRVALQIPETNNAAAVNIFFHCKQPLPCFNKARTGICCFSALGPVSKSRIQRLLPDMDAHPPSPVSRGKIQGLNKFTILLCRSCRAVMKKTKSISDQTCLNRLPSSNMTSSDYPWLFCCCPPTLWHSCRLAC